MPVCDLTALLCRRLYTYICSLVAYGNRKHAQFENLKNARDPYYFRTDYSVRFQYGSIGAFSASVCMPSSHRFLALFELEILIPELHESRRF